MTVLKANCPDPTILVIFGAGGDLTDALYNPARPPHVSHDAGTALVIEHIERHWCPSILSDDLMGGEDHGRARAER